MRNSLIASVVLLIGPSVAAYGECVQSPGGAALALYEKHQDFIFSGVSSPPLSELFARAVSENLAEQRQTGDSGLIDWNYWTDAQDGEQSKGAKVSSIAVKGTRAHVVLTYEFYPSPNEKAQVKRTVVTLSRTPQGCWLIEDVLRGKRSVLSYLQSPESAGALQK